MREHSASFDDERRTTQYVMIFVQMTSSSVAATAAATKMPTRRLMIRSAMTAGAQSKSREGNFRHFRLKNREARWSLGETTVDAWHDEQEECAEAAEDAERAERAAIRRTSVANANESRGKDESPRHQNAEVAHG